MVQPVQLRSAQVSSGQLRSGLVWSRALSCSRWTELVVDSERASDSERA